MSIRKNDYYRPVQHSEYNVPHHRDHETGALYEHVPLADVKGYQHRYNMIKPSIDEAINHHNLIPFNLEKKFLEELGAFQREIDVQNREKEDKKTSDKEVRSERLDRLGQKFKLAGKTASELVISTFNTVKKRGQINWKKT